MGAETHSFSEFLDSAYGVTEGTCAERIEQGDGHQALPELDSLTHRYFTEGIRFGMVTWTSLVRQIGLPMPLTDSFIRLSEVVCGHDWYSVGRTLDTLGVASADVNGIRTAFRSGRRRSMTPALQPKEAIHACSG